MLITWVAVVITASGVGLVAVGTILAWRDHADARARARDHDGVSETVKALAELAKALEAYPAAFRLVILGVLLLLVGAVASLAAAAMQ